MVKRITLGFLGSVFLLVVAAAVGLGWAHLAVRRERGPLPEIEVVRGALLPVADGPVRAFFVNSASQAMPRSAVLDSVHDPRPEAKYVMSHPVFVLEWADGRLLLIDAGMTRAGAVQFGQRIRWLSGGELIQPHRSVAERLGGAVRRVEAIIFTHLHVDHVGGLTELCESADHPIDVFMTEAQAERPNFTTRPGLRMLETAGCARPQRLPAGALVPVPGFPGVTVTPVGGHTPGGQIVLAHVGGEEDGSSYAFLGDVANHIDGILYNVAKPLAYRLLIVPEDEVRLTELRRFARRLQQATGATLLVSHDQFSVEESGIPAWHAHQASASR